MEQPSDRFRQPAFELVSVKRRKYSWDKENGSEEDEKGRLTKEELGFFALTYFLRDLHVGTASKRVGENFYIHVNSISLLEDATGTRRAEKKVKKKIVKQRAEKE